MCVIPSMQIPLRFFSMEKPSYFGAGSSLPVPYECCRHVKPFSCLFLFPYTNHLIYLFLLLRPSAPWILIENFLTNTHLFESGTSATVGLGWSCMWSSAQHFKHNTMHQQNSKKYNAFWFSPFHTPQKRRGSHDLMAIFMGVRVPWAFKVFFWYFKHCCCCGNCLAPTAHCGWSFNRESWPSRELTHPTRTKRKIIFKSALLRIPFQSQFFNFSLWRCWTFPFSVFRAQIDSTSVRLRPTLGVRPFLPLLGWWNGRPGKSSQTSQATHGKENDFHTFAGYH